MKCPTISTQNTCGKRGREKNSNAVGLLFKKFFPFLRERQLWIGRDGHRNGYIIYSQNRNLSRLKLSTYWSIFLIIVPALRETIKLKFQKRRNIISFHFSVYTIFNNLSWRIRTCKQTLQLRVNYCI